MKKTVTVNLGGFVFHIDEDACLRLENYLRKIESGLSNPEEAKEVIHDIELRLSELFKERLGTSRQVINLDDVNHIIKIMGEPEDINDNGSAKKDDSSSRSFGKRMYRDPDNRILGGVGAGLGAYFGIDPVIIRIILVITFFFLGPLLYIVLWIAMPEAKNAAQKLEMRGETVNAENIKKNIRDEYEKVKTNLNKGNTKKEIEDIFREIFLVMGKVFLVFFKVILWIIGIVFIIAGLAILFSFTDIFVFDGWQTGLNGLGDFMTMFVSPAIFNLFIISLFFLVGIPIVAILLGLFRLITGIKTNRYISSGLGIAWFSGIIVIIILGLTQVRNFNTESSKTEVIRLDSLQNHTISLTTSIPEFNENEWSTHESHYLWTVNNDNKFCGLYTLTELYLLTAEDSVTVIKTEKIARGRNKADATKNIECGLCALTLNETSVFIEPGFLVDREKDFRFQRCKIKLYLPVGDTIKLSPEIAQILVRADNTSYFDEYEMAGKTWVMTEKGLKLVE